MLTLPKLSLAFAAHVLSCVDAIHAAKEKALNIFVILTDELGFGDLGLNDSVNIPTPNIDPFLVGLVVRKTAYLARPNGSANPAGLLTGMYPARFADADGALTPLNKCYRDA